MNQENRIRIIKTHQSVYCVYCGARFVFPTTLSKRDVAFAMRGHVERCFASPMRQYTIAIDCLTKALKELFEELDTFDQKLWVIRNWVKNENNNH